jgi:pyridoxine 5-phosphate synthase
LTKAINKLKKNSIEVSLFIDPQIRNVKQALKLKVNNIELHTGTYCNFLINKKKDKAKKEFNKIRASAIFANKKNLGVHCGHGLDYVSTKKIKKIVEISEYNIGHFIISESLFLGFESVVNKFVKIIKK